MAAKMIYSMLDRETQLERHAAIQQLTSEERHTQKSLHNGKTEDEVREELMVVFAQADGEGNGILSKNAIKNCLESVGFFSPKEVSGLLSSINDDTPYADLAEFAFQLVRSIARHA